MNAHERHAVQDAAYETEWRVLGTMCDEYRALTTTVREMGARADIADRDARVLDKARAERDRLRDALARVVDLGAVHDDPRCPADDTCECALRRDVDAALREGT